MAVVGMAKERAVMREFREDKEERYYKRTFLVTVDNLKDDGVIVERAFGLPYAGQEYVTEVSVDKYARCLNKLCNQIGLLHWEVVCEYSTKQDSGKGTGSQKKPEEEDPVYTWDGTNIKEVVTGQCKWENRYDHEQDPNQVDGEGEVRMWDRDGVTNSAWEPYNPPAEIDRMIPTLTFERNEPYFNHRYMLYYVNSVNSDTWFGWHPKMVKCASIKGSLQVKIVNKKPYQYWKVQYVFQFNKFTWDLFLLDIGSYHLVGGSSAVPKVKKSFIIKGVPGLGLLQANGDASSNSTTVGSKGQPLSRYNQFEVLPRLDFNMLMIPLIP